MQPLNVAIVAVEDFSPFHFSVPCIIFSDKVAAKSALRCNCAPNSRASFPRRMASPLPQPTAMKRWRPPTL